MVGGGEEEVMTGDLFYRKILWQPKKQIIVGRKENYKTQPKIGIMDCVHFVQEILQERKER